MLGIREIENLQTKAIIRRTQARDFVEAFVAKTYDGRTVCLDVYESEERGKWFVILMPGFIGWTSDETAAFSILDNCGLFTLIELLTQAAAKRGGRK